MDRRYLSASDVRARLSDSIVRWRGVPVLIRAPEGRAHAYPLRNLSGEGEVIDPNSRHLDSASPPLGFVNIRGEAVYAARYPHRAYKAGLTENNVQLTSINGGKLRGSTVLFSPNMADTIEGVYPSFQEALKIAEGGIGCAFSRHLAVDNKKRIWCYTNKIGVMRGGRIVTLRKFPPKMGRILEEATGLRMNNVG